MYPREVLFAIMLLVVSFLVRVKQGVSEFSLGDSFSSTLSYMLKAFLSGIVNEVTSVGNGAIEGLAAFLWGGHHWREGWRVRVICYPYVAIQYDSGSY